MAGESLRLGGAVFAKAMRRTYGNLGMIMVISLIWFGLAALPAGYFVNFALHVPSIFSYLIIALEMVFIAGPVTAAVYSMANALLNDEEPSLKDMWIRFRRHYRLSAQVTGAMVGIFFILGIDIIMFVQSQIRLVRWLAILWLYFVAFWVMLNTYTAPLVVFQQVGWLKVLQRAALLVLDNLIVTILVLAEMVLVVALSFFFILPVPLFMGGALAVLQLTALQALMEKYDIAKSPTETK